jgi:hypothetical protein
MKQYLAFVPVAYEGHGGWSDILQDDSGNARSFDSSQEALDAVLEHIKKLDWMTDVLFHIVDTQKGEVVVMGSPDRSGGPRQPFFSLKIDMDYR